MEQKLTSPNKWDKELHGENIYNPNIKELVGFQMTCLEKMYDYNQTRPSQMEKRAELIKEMFAEAGEGCISSRRFMQTGADGMFILVIMFMLTSG